MDSTGSIPMSLDPLAILVIDDDPGICNLLLEALHDERYLVVTVHSAEEGLAQLPCFNFAVAFVDHVLPRMDGLTLSGYLRRANPLIEVVLMTGEETPRLRHAAQEEGIRFLGKPLSIEQVTRLVEEQHQALHQRAEKMKHADPWFCPRLDLPLLDEAAAQLGLPPAPERLREAVVVALRDALAHLRSRGRYNEKDRLLLFAGILAARLLRIPLPAVMDGRSFAEEYDRLMLRLGKRSEFGAPPEEAGR
ncbi:MAG: response regulator [Deltaproteobacteria bacterium]|nr:response regulator [Deltaproteobacteria bacterium]